MNPDPKPYPINPIKATGTFPTGPIITSRSAEASAMVGGFSAVHSSEAQALPETGIRV